VSKTVEELFAKEKPATLHVVSSAHGRKAESSVARKGSVVKDAFELKAEKAEIRLEKL
jgi:hypothetical protein